jgi:hypothetical protein
MPRLAMKTRVMTATPLDTVERQGREQALGNEQIRCSTPCSLRQRQIFDDVIDKEGGFHRDGKPRGSHLMFFGQHWRFGTPAIKEMKFKHSEPPFRGSIRHRYSI